jgi:MoaA/NifB/PqqE/SkfB family radical SAM enzyme
MTETLLRPVEATTGNRGSKSLVREAAAPNARAKPRGALSSKLDILRLVFEAGGPGFCQFALNNACNANCGFCNFARDQLPKDRWTYVDREGALDAIEILHRRGIRYLVLTGGEPTLHPNHVEFVRHGAALGMKVMLVTNGGLLKDHKVRELAAAGLSSLIISIDAASREVHERNRGLPGVCERIVDANRTLHEIGMHATASVTMSRLVDYDALPDFLEKLGFTSVVFSYPLTYLPSFFLGYSDSGLVDHSKDELIAAYDKIKQLKKRFRVVNPGLSLDEMQRFVRNEEQRYPCLAGWRFFFLDWDLRVWRCHAWDRPMCSIYEFDETKFVRDGCTKCMINCYRDSSLLQHVATSVHDGWQAYRRGQVVEGTKALMRRSNLDSLRAVVEELPWIVRF